MKKYELVEDMFLELNYSWYNETLHRIRALRDIPGTSVKAGDIGGWVLSEENLSQEGKCWIYGNAMVLCNAIVSDDARVENNARIDEDAHVYGEAVVSDHARIYGQALIHDNAHIFDWAKVGDQFEVCGNAIVFGYAVLESKRGKAKMDGWAEVFHSN